MIIHIEDPEDLAEKFRNDILSRKNKYTIWDLPKRQLIYYDGKKKHIIPFDEVIDVRLKQEYNYESKRSNRRASKA